MEKKLIPNNELKETRHGMSNNMIEQACAYAYPIMHICRYAHMGTKQSCESYSKVYLSLIRKDY